MSNFKSIALATLVITMAAALSGCNQVGSTVSTDDGYYAEERMSETEYQVFISKKTSTILDKLAAHAATATNISNGEYSAESECDNVAVTIGTIEEAYEDISKMGPAIDYEKSRENLLNQLDEAKTHLEEYKEFLESGEKITSEAMSDFAAKFKNDFTVIKAF